MGDKLESSAGAAWPAAARVVAQWLDRRERIDQLLEAIPAGMAGVERARCQHLVLGVVRHAGRLEMELSRLVAHLPRFAVRAALFLAGFELLDTAEASDGEGRAARIVHHAVEQTKALASPAEARLVNAVGRRLAERLREAKPPPRLAQVEALAEYFSHPDWLVRRWLARFGAQPTRALLEWNQKPSPVYARWRSPEAGAPDWLAPTAWPGFFEVPSGRWAEAEALLRAGRIYFQDPASRRAAELLGPKPGEAVLDACAAPGGKSLLLADRMAAGGSPGRLVALDLPGDRIARLRENLGRVSGVEASLLEADLRQGPAKRLRDAGLPAAFAAVLVDAPCSNSGVMRRRADVKWRLQEGDFGRHARQQGALLDAAARLVAPGGRLVYSTCSIDPEENEAVAKDFLRRAEGAFKAAGEAISLPWREGHDGGGAFLFVRV